MSLPGLLRKPRQPGVAFLAAAVLLCWSSTFGRSQPNFVSSNVQVSSRGVAGTSAVQANQAPLRTGASSESVPSRPSHSFAACAGLAVLALLAPRRHVLSRNQSAAPRVIMHARSAKPTTPSGSPKNKRRMAAGRKRPIYMGRQLAVRVNPRTNKPVRYKMHVMPGDIVQVMKGKDKGKVTEVLRIYPKWNKILCLGVNYCIKHVRPMREDEVGQRVQVEAPMHSSWVMHYDEEEEVAGLLGVRFEKRTLEDGMEIVKKVRYNKSTGNEIPVSTPSKWVPVLDRVEDED
ncbi:rplX [Symbiodinium natans]|uniref:Large ribosomal subunit protein uL24c n=1 Tax=Symbiodinium natans TaxID=878477 RepID=A0A812QP95_9DINO|nr:rplX [Symbiodinium natans]